MVFEEKLLPEVFLVSNPRVLLNTVFEVNTLSEDKSLIKNPCRLLLFAVFEVNVLLLDPLSI